ncbi:hypothetical protein QE152_g39563 [Popillia japonica]|uniref:Uncharacterized protein n=1 Tax=Popillia japonica TaxID=7064 RepID=A0AAW1HTT2_POPJA
MWLSTAGCYVRQKPPETYPSDMKFSSMTMPSFTPRRTHRKKWDGKPSNTLLTCPPMSIPCSRIESLRRKRFGSNEEVECAGNKIEPLGKITVSVRFQNEERCLDFYVIKNGGPPLVGRNFLHEFNVGFKNFNFLSNEIGS